MWLTLRHLIGINSRAIGVAAIGAVAVAGPALGYETDPYTKRHIELSDSQAILDAKMNEALDDIAASWAHGEDEWAFVTAIYRRLGGRHWVDKLERWAMEAQDVAKLPVGRRESVYAGLPLHAARVARVWARGRTINVGGTYMGTDKLGHFLSQGRKFYARNLRLGSIDRAAHRTATWEALIWGRLTTGVYSNADLVANYEGFLFYRGLFNDAVVADKQAMFRWDDGRPVRQRTFSWADHVNPFWDEALNPNDYAPALIPHMQRRMLRLCDDFEQRPDRYRVPDEAALKRRYAGLYMRDAAKLAPARYLPRACPAALAQAAPF